MSKYWSESYSCIECGNLDANPHAQYCATCGSRCGHFQVMVKIREKWFSKKVVDVRLVSDLVPNRYIKNLAKLLEIEADGEEVAYLTDAMQVAITEAAGR